MLPFTAEILFSDFAQYNRALWPLPVLASGLGLAAILLTLRPLRRADLWRFLHSRGAAARLERRAAADALLPLPRRSIRLGGPGTRSCGAGPVADRRRALWPRRRQHARRWPRAHADRRLHPRPP